MKLSNLLITILSATAFVACSNGGRSYSKVPYCPVGVEQLALAGDENYNRKVQLKPNEPIATEQTDFAFGSAQAYYYDTVNDIQILLNSTRDASGAIKTSVGCVGGSGFNPSLKAHVLDIPVISDLLVNNNSTEIRTRVFKIDLQYREPGEPWLKFSSDVLATEFVPGDVLNFYPDYQEVSQYFTQLKNDPTTHQLVSHMKTVGRDDKSGRDGEVIVRTLVNYKPVNADERKSRDDNDKKWRDKEKENKP
jgi:hypothetical protein